MENKGNIWEGVDVIHSYSRRDALEDGVLVDASELAREAGFKWPVAVTRGVWAILEPSEELKQEGQSWTGRAWDLLTVLRLAIRNTPRADEVRFSPLFIRRPGAAPEPVSMWAQCAPGDEGEPVITVMLRGED